MPLAIPLDRRRFLAAAALTLAPRLTWAAAGAPSFLAAAGLPDGRFVLLGLGEDGGERFRVDLPARGHAAAAHPTRPEAVAFARRPGSYAIVLDCLEGDVLTRLAAPEGRAFQGHGAFSPDGATLFTTETAEEGRGVLGLWDVRAGYTRTGEIESGGDGPHEVLLMPGGTQLAVANGGIATDTASGRAPLNPFDMRPNLTLIDVGSGEIAQVLEAPEPLARNSLRHLAAAPDGTLAMALQWEGAEIEHPPLLALRRPGAAELEFRAAPEAMQREMRNYAGSVAVSQDGTRIAITSPRGGIMLVFERDRDGVELVRAADVCGVAWSGGGFACTTGQGAFLGPGGGGAARHAGLSFDNHLIRVASA
jgi:hypothetical protein